MHCKYRGIGNALFHFYNYSSVRSAINDIFEQTEDIVNFLIRIRDVHVIILHCKFTNNHTYQGLVTVKQNNTEIFNYYLIKHNEVFTINREEYRSFLVEFESSIKKCNNPTLNKLNYKSIW